VAHAGDKRLILEKIAPVPQRSDSRCRQQ